MHSRLSVCVCLSLHGNDIYIYMSIFICTFIYIHGCVFIPCCCLCFALRTLALKVDFNLRWFLRRFWQKNGAQHRPVGLLVHLCSCLVSSSLLLNLVHGCFIPNSNYAFWPNSAHYESLSALCKMLSGLILWHLVALCQKSKGT